MIYPYQDFQDRISKAINLGGWKFPSQILRAELEEERSPDILKSVECKYSVEVFQVKILSPCVKDDVLYFHHLILKYYGL